ncbi:MAG TPA: nitroreductase [Rubrivivax sp.]|nr:nitroreductase [Rubrivivax sp.]
MEVVATERWPGYRAGVASTGVHETQEPEEFLFAQALVGSRQNVSPKRLVEPGPSATQLEALLGMAAAAPDHGLLTPWRFVLIPADQRHRLAEVFALALVDRDPGATIEQIESAREKAHRAPLLLVAIAGLGPREPDTPALERMVSMGAAIQNLLLGAHAMGYGAGLTSGQAMSSPRLGAMLGLAEGEVPVCCINIGTVTKRKTSLRSRPSPAAILSELADAGLGQAATSADSPVSVRSRSGAMPTGGCGTQGTT